MRNGVHESSSSFQKTMKSASVHPTHDAALCRKNIDEKCASVCADLVFLSQQLFVKEGETVEKEVIEQFQTALTKMSAEWQNLERVVSEVITKDDMKAVAIRRAARPTELISGIHSMVHLEADIYSKMNKVSGVLQPSKTTIVFDPKDLLGTHLLKSFDPNSKAFKIGIAISTMLYFVSALPAVAASWNFISRSYLWINVLQYPLLILALSACNKRILFELVKQFPFLVFNFYNLLFFISFLLMRSQGENHAGFVHQRFGYLLSFIIISLADSMPPWFQSVTRKYVLPSCFPLVIGEWFALYFNWLQLEDIDYGFTGYIKFSSASTYASTALISMMTIYAHNIWQGFTNPDQLIMIMSNVEIKLLHEGGARILAAADQIKAAATNKSTVE